ncbi:MAG: sugar phosphate isomerase/epimerase [Spirochaetes bacterium]|nr:sugar phosphate isomerase/epimerase [Spirochaetota bacterium]
MTAPETRIAVTLYTLRDHCKTPEDLDKTLRRVKDIGYEAVQVSGVPGSNIKKIKQLLDKYNIYCCASHENLDNLKNNLSEIVRKLKILNCSFTALGHPGNNYWSTEGVKTLPGVLETIGKQLKEEGIIFGYHNHAAEFEKFTGKTFLQEIYDNVPGNILSAELDTYWVQHGGGNPAQWINRLKERIHILHFKDYTVCDDKPVFCEVGEGNLDWENILTAAENSTARWYVVEQDNPFKDRDIFKSIEISFDNMKKTGIK